MVILVALATVLGAISCPEEASEDTLRVTLPSRVSFLACGVLICAPFLFPVPVNSRNVYIVKSITLICQYYLF